MHQCPWPDCDYEGKEEEHLQDHLRDKHGGETPEKSEPGEEESKTFIERIKKGIDRAVIVAGLIMVVGFAMDPNFRTEIANGIGFIFQPLTVFTIDWAIFLVALITAIITTVIQKFTMSGEVSEAQKRMKEIRSELKEAKLQDNDERVEELKEKQTEMMSETLGTQMKMIKPMFYIMAITIPIFAWIYVVTSDPSHLQVFAHGEGIPTGLLIPFLGQVNFTKTFYFIPGGIVWYIICSLPLSQLVRKILNVEMGA